MACSLVARRIVAEVLRVATRRSAERAAARPAGRLRRARPARPASSRARSSAAEGDLHRTVRPSRDGRPGAFLAPAARAPSCPPFAAVQTRASALHSATCSIQQASSRQLTELRVLVRHATAAPEIAQGAGDPHVVRRGHCEREIRQRLALAQRQNAPGEGLDPTPRSRRRRSAPGHRAEAGPGRGRGAGCPRGIRRRAPARAARPPRATPRARRARSAPGPRARSDPPRGAGRAGASERRGPGS